MAIAALILGAIAAFRRTGEKTTSTERVILACAGLALAVHFATWIGSLDYTSVAVSTLLVSTTPVWTALYDAIFRKAPMPRAALGAFVAGAIGLFAIVKYNTAAAPYAGEQLWGDALAITGALAFAAYLLLVRDVRVRLNTRTIVTHTYAWAAFALVIAAACARQPPPPLNASVAWGGILAMALVSQLLGHTALNASLRWFTPSAVAFSTLLEPVTAALLALVIFNERIAPAALAGGLLVLGAIAVVLWTDPKQELD